jgi:lipopolysaccharide/colanic/teichoic acid biosynthesis glycosyltransferase
MALDNVTVDGVSANAVQILVSPKGISRADGILGRTAKRVFDLMVVLCVLAITAIPMIILAITIKVTTPGPIIFRQLRVGKNGRLFLSYKFRSMHVDAEQRLAEVSHLNEFDGPLFKIRDDPRITPVGRFLRRTSLDELPQVFNVLRGQMSIVGPRPALMSEIVRFENDHLGRLAVKPGMTGPWQVSGRSEIPFQTMMKLDMDYVERWSLWLDVQLLLRTIPAVISGRGAY